jgi:hypothetical protein
VLKPIRIPMAVDPLVMVPNYLCDLLIVGDVLEYSLTYSRMLFHLTPLLERQGPRLFEQARGEPYFPNVVYEPTDVRESLVVFIEAESRRDIARVCRN